MQLPQVSGEFRTAEPSFRYSTNGTAVFSVGGAVTPRRKNKQTDEWEDGPTTWVNLTAFGKLAENLAESIEKGMLVIAMGRLQVEEYEDSNGQKQRSTKIIVDTMGPSLRYATAKVTKVERTQPQQGAQPQPAGDDPWAVPPQQASGWQGPAGGEPPF